MEILLLLDAKIIILGLSVLIASIAIHRNTIIAKRRATVDLVLQQRNDESLTKANELVNPILNSNDITKFADESNKDSPEREAILTILNNYEFISVGIRENAFDIKIFKRMNYGIVVRDWSCFKPFVVHLRERHDRPTLFQEFEWLATKFKKKKLKVDND